MNVLPVPVGMTTTPRRPLFIQAFTASVWYGRAVRSAFSFQPVGSFAQPRAASSYGIFSRISCSTMDR